MRAWELRDICVFEIVKNWFEKCEFLCEISEEVQKSKKGQKLQPKWKIPSKTMKNYSPS